jgi:hypothetical protein
MTTNQTPPAVWIDGDPLMEAIAAAVWEQCRTEDTSLVVDDPRNIAAVAARAVSSVGQAPATDQTAVCICGHTEAQHFEDVCITEITGCDCGDFLPPDAAREVIDRWQEAAMRKTTDRAAVLREAATLGRELSRQGYSAQEIAKKLDRLADEAAVPGRTTDEAAGEAHPPYHRWYVETRDGLADEWAPGMRFTERAEAVERYETLNQRHPTWKDGTPVERRLVRETTTYTVELAPAVGGAQQPTEDRPFIPPAHYRRDDGVDCCVHAIPIGPDSCRHCRELAET